MTAAEPRAPSLPAMRLLAGGLLIAMGGPDLQYTRINGTLIGGLIGLAIHQATLLLS